MKFTLSEPNEILDVQRWLSEEGKWELGLRQMLFGVRVSLSQIGGCAYTIDYCAADNPGFAIVLLFVVSKILERYPEDVTPRQLERDFPGYTIKPIDRDPDCWPRLVEMAGEVKG